MKNNRCLVSGLTLGFSLLVLWATAGNATAQPGKSHSVFKAIGRSHGYQYPDEEAMNSEALQAMLQYAKEQCGDAREVGPRTSNWVGSGRSWHIRIESFFACGGRRAAHASAATLNRELESCDQEVIWPSAFERTLRDMYIEAYLCETAARASVVGVEHRDCENIPVKATWDLFWVCE